MNVRDRHRIDLSIFFVFFIITSIGLLFRNLIHYYDKVQFIEDSLGNIGGVIVSSFLFFWWVKESSFKKREIIIFSVGLGLIIYEVLQVLIPWQTFDMNDILGTLIGIIIASIINISTVVLRKQKLSS